MKKTDVAKEKLKKILGKPFWLKGIGFCKNKGNICLKVNVESLSNDGKIPTVVDGIPVIVEVVGKIKAYGN